MCVCVCVCVCVHVWVCASLLCVLLLLIIIYVMQADVYVNTTNTALTITSGGAISTLLAKAAGPQLQQECSQKAPIGHGDVAVTGAGGNLKCQKTFHIALPQQYTKGQAEEVRY